MAVITSSIFCCKVSNAVCSVVMIVLVSERLAFKSATLEVTLLVVVAVSPRELFTFPTFWLEVSSLPFISSSLPLESSSIAGAVPLYPDNSCKADNTSSLPEFNCITTSMYAFFSFWNSSSEPFRRASSSMPNCLSFAESSAFSTISVSSSYFDFDFSRPSIRDS